MAVARGTTQSGFTAAHAWMIVFVVLWLVSTGLLVWVYTDQEAVKKANEELRADNRRLVSADEQSLPAFGKARAEGPTVVGALEQDRSQTARLATGVPEDEPAVVGEKTRELLSRIVEGGLVPDPSAFADTSLLGALDTLYTAYTGLYEQWTAAVDRAEELNGQVEALAEANATQRDEFDAKAGEIAQQIAELEAAWEDYRGTREAQIAEFERNFEEFRQQSSKDIQEQQTEKRRLEKDLEEVRSRFAELQQKLGELQITPPPLQTLREPDGLILTAKPGEDVVYINLGRQDHLTLGLQFAVYDPDTGIPADGRGKARIEVVSIYERSAACKLVEIFGSSRVIQGDLVANPVYDRDRPLKFLVLGQFDLDQDGRTDPQGVAQVEALIQSWGGEVVDAVSARIDFVVVGEAPEVPRVIGDQSPEVVERNKPLVEAYERFQSQFEAARALSIPMLTQQVFLHFLGYGTGEALSAA